MLGATDTKVGYVTADGQAVTTKGPNQDAIPLGAPELAVARGESNYSCRTITSQRRRLPGRDRPDAHRGHRPGRGPVARRQRVHARHARRW